jgi:hypothetical protein
MVKVMVVFDFIPTYQRSLRWKIITLRHQMHNDYKKPFILEWFNGKKFFQVCKTFEQHTNDQVKINCQPISKLVLHKIDNTETLFIFN